MLPPPALAAAYNFSGHPPFWQAPRPTIGRTLTPQVKDFGLCRKAAALTFSFSLCMHCRTLLCKFQLMPNSFFSGKKPVLAITQAHSAHLEKAALERLTIFFDFLASPPAPKMSPLPSEFYAPSALLPLVTTALLLTFSAPARCGAAAVDR